MLDSVVVETTRRRCLLSGFVAEIRRGSAQLQLLDRVLYDDLLDGLVVETQAGRHDCLLSGLVVEV